MRLPTPDALHAARVAMLQAAVSAFFCDFADDNEDFELRLDCQSVGGLVSIDVTHTVSGVPVSGYSL